MSTQTVGALLFCDEVASADTPLAGSRLVIEQTAVKVFSRHLREGAETGFHPGL